MAQFNWTTSSTVPILELNWSVYQVPMCVYLKKIPSLRQGPTFAYTYLEFSSPHHSRYAYVHACGLLYNVCYWGPEYIHIRGGVRVMINSSLCCSRRRRVCHLQRDQQVSWFEDHQL